MLNHKKSTRRISYAVLVHFRPECAIMRLYLLKNYLDLHSQSENFKTMNELQVIQSKIFEIRGQKVMLDYDLAEMYGVETRVLNQAVKRNLSRFPFDFMFQLTPDEWKYMSSQIVMTYTLKRPKSALPYAFTEHGVVMLSSVLRSETAIQVNIAVTRAFVAVRQMIYDNSPLKRLSNLEKDFKELKSDLEEIFSDYNDINEDTRAQLDAINTTLAELQSKQKSTSRRPVGFIQPEE